MRISTSLRLLILCVLAGGSLTLASQAEARPSSSGPKKVVLKEEFEGYGLTERDAEANALERACDWLASQPNLGWTPTPEYLREKEGMVQFSDPTDKKFASAEGISKDGKMKVVTLRLEITADQARDIQKQAQHQRMKERQKYSLLAVLGVLALVGVVGGYLRLEEATKGYYTRRLRLTAIAIVLIVIALLGVIA